MLNGIVITRDGPDSLGDDVLFDATTEECHVNGNGYCEPGKDGEV